VLPPLERAGRQLILSAGELEQALRRVNNGPRWVSYLKLPDGVLGRGVDAGAERAPETQPDAPEAANALFDALIRYDEVSRNPQYGVIAELPAFKATHERLAGYIGLLSSRSPSEPPQGAGIEVLPAPEPEAN